MRSRIVSHATLQIFMRATSAYRSSPHFSAAHAPKSGARANAKPDQRFLRVNVRMEGVDHSVLDSFVELCRRTAKGMQRESVSLRCACEEMAQGCVSLFVLPRSVCHYPPVHRYASECSPNDTPCLSGHGRDGHHVHGADPSPDQGREDHSAEVAPREQEAQATVWPHCPQ